MNTAKHTPGPWHVSTTHIGEIAVADSRGINLCVLGDASLFDAITPDAAIIAAAPAMYEALQAIVSLGRQPKNRGDSRPFATREEDIAAIAEQALAQAEGK